MENYKKINKEDLEKMDCITRKIEDQEDRNNMAVAGFMANFSANLSTNVDKSLEILDLHPVNETKTFKKVISNMGILNKLGLEVSALGGDENTDFTPRQENLLLNFSYKDLEELKKLQHQIQNTLFKVKKFKKDNKGKKVDKTGFTVEEIEYSVNDNVYFINKELSPFLIEAFIGQLGIEGIIKVGFNEGKTIIEVQKINL